MDAHQKLQTYFMLDPIGNYLTLHVKLLLPHICVKTSKSNVKLKRRDIRPLIRQFHYDPAVIYKHQLTRSLGDANALL